ncbi:MAG TPA: D-aminoacylase [Blastocatellia bacterium]|nr:D-aminoacylase [Blastocatellia bacterium]HMV87587.1 D-aminoacylase [Blastocatellia bacterium]HMY71333.1 D-aminoacylase [Blastocatellia bacterium]HMZ19351.1 D-aminoacylase [Blastocatellia bacterium]HNG34365.1 D-aminoacylase [Blastocatellia bacterium]
MKTPLQFLFCLFLLAIPALHAMQTQQYDVLIRGGRIVDGTGNSWFRADVALRGDTIVAIGKLDGATARRVIEANGQIVAPGFIDIHSHARRQIFEETKAENYIRQGVTTAIEGPDGSSPLPLKPFFDQLRQARIAINMGALVGQGSIREKVIGLADRRATPEEIEKMKALVKEAMEQGALGLSTGLFYVPGNYTPTEEVIELAKVAGQMGGIHTSHMRDEAANVLKSVEETIAIGERGGLPTQVTHHKIIGKGNWGRSTDTLRVIAEARARGVDVTIDQYPYTASSTGLAALLPQWSQEGGQRELGKRLNDPATRAKIKAAVIENIKFDRGGGDPKNIAIARCSWDQSLEGKNLAEITQARGRTVTIENAAETALEIVAKGGASAIFHAINEDDLVRILKDPLTMIASDGGVEIPKQGVPHPRSYGTFARVLGVYVREKRVLSLEDAVRKMTSLPAARLGLPDRGLLRPGMKADIAIFDPARIIDRATFADPHQYAEGVSYVIVNGSVVLDNGRITESRSGQVLLGAAARK